MTCDDCRYSGPAPAYPPNTVRVCTHPSTVLGNCPPTMPVRYWSGQEVSLALTVCKGRGYRKVGHVESVRTPATGERAVNHTGGLFQ